MTHIVVPTNIRMSLLALEYAEGGAFENPGERGISHLLEHLMCKTFDKHREKMKSLGLDYNAYTDNNQVVFWLSGLDTSLNEMAYDFYDSITKQETLWTPEGFENEKKTVLQEYGDCFNEQTEGFFENLFRKYYNYTNAIGYRKDIVDFTYEQSLEYAHRYKTPRMLCQVGKENINPATFMAKRGAVTNRLVYTTDSGLELENIPKEDKTIVGLLGMPVDVKDIARFSLLVNCLTGGLESPLYQEIREKRGLSYYSVGFANTVGNTMVPMFYASTGNDRAVELAKVYEDFFSRPVTDLLSLDRFNTCHKSLMIKKEIAEILPHAGAKSTIIAEHNPFKDMETFTYEEALVLFSKILNPVNLTPVQH